MNNKEYRRRAQLAKEIAEGECYRSYPMWGVDYTDTIRSIIKNNRKLVKEQTNYFAVPGCDYRCVLRVDIEDDATIYTLISYDTEVCYIRVTFDSCQFIRTWDGWTPTTMKHINAFRDEFGFVKMNKYMWLTLDEPEYRW